MASIHWQLRAFDELSTRELYALIAAREAVFIVEQHCAYLDADGLDLDAKHLLGWDGDSIAAYLRVLPPGTKYSEAAIGRVLTVKTHRGTGIGQIAMQRAIEFVDATFPNSGVRISAQAHLERFYSGFGFVRVSDTYLEDGIPHIEMLRAESRTCASMTP
jgi:ElaA protein